MSLECKTCGMIKDKSLLIDDRCTVCYDPIECKTCGKIAHFTNFSGSKCLECVKVDQAWKNLTDKWENMDKHTEQCKL